MKEFRIVYFAWLLVTAWFLTSCGTNTTSETYMPYEMRDASTFGGRKTDDSPITDTHSHWEGDGVRGDPRIEIDISDQMAYFFKGRQLVGKSKISTGTDEHATPTGSFKITQKSADHRSNLYGDYVYPDGSVAQKDVDVTKDKKPPGAKFEGAPMPFFMRFKGGVGMHAGYLPGYAASHGCVRMPKRMAETFFRNVSLKTPVIVRD